MPRRCWASIKAVAALFVRLAAVSLQENGFKEKYRMARVAVVGVGAIGGAIAGLLQSAGRHELLLCTRRPLPKFSVESPDGVVTVEAANLTNPSHATAVDWALVATKAYAVEATAQWLKHLCANGAPVAVLQNGVEHRERFAPYLPMQSILPVVVDCPVERVAPDKFLQRRAMQLKAPDDALGREFAGLFEGTAAEIRLTPDFQTAAWRKLCLNAAGALPAILLQPAGVFHEQSIGEVALQIIRECVAVGRAEGAKLGDEAAAEVLKTCRASTPDSVNSLHADRLAGRPMEIDARNGVIVRLGKKHGIPTPTNAMAVALLETMSRMTP
jgi:2-dehydropantoate 2-reductase